METIITALISGLCVAIPNLIATKRQAQENHNLVIYRIEQLEKKVTKHNNLVERVYEIEKKIDVHNEEYNNLKEKVEVLE